MPNGRAPEPFYVYRARVTRVLDGDSFIARVDLGFAVERGGEGITTPIRVRVRGLFCPEVNELGGAEARFHALSLLWDPADAARPYAEQAAITLRSYKDARSFERWVCDVWLPDGRPFAQAMIDAGHGSATA